ncbi:PorH family porin [Corynebacterium phoceense]|uniref:PorH family porin n=1 Tax=Corynebacterium phoceense TaxID=1686286 RepID=UPI00211BC70E|nr:PorH family porin [Corynebacterium phoceense]MCQ9333909.1 PorH family porin [Corynebacterium phoceense]
MDLSFITEQLDNFSTFGNAIHGLFTGFAEFATNLDAVINGNLVDNDKNPVDLTENTQGVFDALSSKSEA